MKLGIVSALFLTIPALFVPAYAQSCFETATCTVDPADPLTFLIQPLTMSMGDWIFIAVWGMIIGFIWIRTGNALYAGFIGIIISSSLTAGSTVLTSLAPAMQMAMIMLACSFGLVLYSVFRRANQT